MKTRNNGTDIARRYLSTNKIVLLKFVMTNDGETILQIRSLCGEISGVNVLLLNDGTRISFNALKIAFVDVLRILVRLVKRA